MTARYRRFKQRGHPLAAKNNAVLVHRDVLYRKIGPGAHPCHWCGIEVAWMVGHGARKGGLVSDHVDGDILNNDLENLVPACNTCNTTRMRKGLIQDDEDFIVRRGKRIRADRKTCKTCGIEFLAERFAIPRVYCSQTCDAVGRRGGHPNCVKPGELFTINAKGDRQRATERTCLHCGNSFLVNTSMLKHMEKTGKQRTGIYCSRTCTGAARRSQSS